MPVSTSYLSLSIYFVPRLRGVSPPSFDSTSETLGGLHTDRRGRPLEVPRVGARKRQFRPEFLATFPAVGVVPTIVVGRGENTAARTSTRWALTLLHEHFRQLQYSQPWWCLSPRLVAGAWRSPAGSIGRGGRGSRRNAHAVAGHDHEAAPPATRAYLRGPAEWAASAGRAGAGRSCDDSGESVDGCRRRTGGEPRR